MSVHWSIARKTDDPITWSYPYTDEIHYTSRSETHLALWVVETRDGQVWLLDGGAPWPREIDYKLAGPFKTIEDAKVAAEMMDAANMYP